MTTDPRHAAARRLRETTSMTVTQIAAQLGVTKSTVHRWTSQDTKPPCPICFRAGCRSQHPDCSPKGKKCTRCGESLRTGTTAKVCGFCLEEERLGVAA